MSVLPFPTPDAQLVKATLAMAETEQLKAQLDYVRADRDYLAERLDGLVFAAQAVKRASTQLERDMALSLLLAKALVANDEPRDCPTCEQTPCERTCPERER